MNELLDQLDFSFSENFSITTYVINIIIATILLYILSYVYEKQGNSVSNRKQLGRVLILVGVTTFIIISIVKSSLALSLGLVGALSIVRFRTAIKEPEELGFFYINFYWTWFRSKSISTNNNWFYCSHFNCKIP